MKLRLLLSGLLLLSAQAFSETQTITKDGASGSFALSSTDDRGHFLVNNTNCNVMFSFEATGLWKHHPGRDWVSPSGENIGYFSFYRHPNLPSGALVVETTPGQAWGYAEHTGYVVAPGGHATLVMNDSVSGYNDNVGAILVKWESGTLCN